MSSIGIAAEHQKDLKDETVDDLAYQRQPENSKLTMEYRPT